MAKKDVKKVRITVPQDANDESNQISVSVNGKVYLIRRGVAVSVPVEVAEVIKNSEIAKSVAVQYIEKQTDKKAKG